MEVQNGNVDVVEQLSVVLHRVATGEEDDDLLLHVFLEEGVQEPEACIGRAYHIALCKSRYSASGFFLVDIDEDGIGTERYASEVGNFCRLGGGVKHGLAVLYLPLGRVQSSSFLATHLLAI